MGMAARCSGERSSAGTEMAWKGPPSASRFPLAKVRTPQVRQKLKVRCGSGKPGGVQRYSDTPAPSSRRKLSAPLAKANQARILAQYEQLQRLDPSARSRSASKRTEPQWQLPE